MKNANVLTGIILALTGILNIVSANWISASCFLALAATFLLIDATSARARDLVINTSLLPAWRRFSVLLLLGVSVGLVGFQAGYNLKDKVKASRNQQTSPRQ